jgi:hypothetical protein
VTLEEINNTSFSKPNNNVTEMNQQAGITGQNTATVGPIGELRARIG